MDVYIKLIAEREGKFIYDYYPHGNMNIPGRIAVDKNHNVDIISVSSGDIKNRYLALAVRDLRPEGPFLGRKTAELYF